MADKSLWDLASDVFTDYEGTITEAGFQFSDKGNQIKFVFDEIDGRQDPQFEYYSLPPGWETPDGGETIQRVAGDDKGIVKSSQWGKFLAAAGACEGARDALGENAPVDATAWIGTRWSMEITAAGKGKAYSFNDRETGEKVEGVSKDKNYPVEFLGKEMPGTSQSSAANGQNGNGKVDNLSVLTDIHNPVVEAKIAELAATLPHNEWFRQGFDLLKEAGVTGQSHPDLVAAMGGRGLYESLGGKA